jgi:hypothetical protein
VPSSENLISLAQDADEEAVSAALVKSVVYWVLTCMHGVSIPDRAALSKIMAKTFGDKYPDLYSNVLESISRTEEDAGSAEYWEDVVSEIVCKYPSQAVSVTIMSFDGFSYKLPFSRTMLLTLETLESFPELGNVSNWSSPTSAKSVYFHAKDQLAEALKKFFGEHYDQVRAKVKHRDFASPRTCDLDLLTGASREAIEWIDWRHLAIP